MKFKGIRLTFYNVLDISFPLCYVNLKLEKPFIVLEILEKISKKLVTTQL